MQGIIRLLPDSLANQIAAGEVVQRPASAVKELLENSIDAGATEVTLIVKEAGKALIQVIDNGKGMSENDARMCFERHATSKLKTTEDLFNILTFGFRGEAMASIAAVTQVELKTKREEDELGTLIQIEGSSIKKQEEVVCPTGTSISIKNLFYNIPARRNFLKSNATELSHISEEFQRVALAYPEISFSFFQNDLEIFRIPGEKLSQRIISLFGKSYQTQLIPVEEDTEYIKIQGYIGKPQMSKKSRGEQYFFANRRFIKHHYLNHAITNGYDGMLTEKSFPFYVLNIQIDPKSIDINVHPTKTEVKFDDEKTIYAILQAVVRKALGTHNITPSLDFSADVNFGVETAGKRDYGNGKGMPFEIPDFIKEKNNSSVPSFGNTKPANNNNSNHWENLYEGFDANSFDQFDQEKKEQTLLFDSAVNQEQEHHADSKNNNAFQLQNSFIITKLKSGLIIINQELAHQRVLYEKYLLNINQNAGPSQQCLFPQTVEFNAIDFGLIIELQNEIQKLGFQFEIFGKNAIIINGIPAEITVSNEKELFESFVEQIKWNKNELNIELYDNLARSLAKRTSIKAGKKMNSTEISHLVDQLFACKQPAFSPTGEACYTILDIDSIYKLF